MSSPTDWSEVVDEGHPQVLAVAQRECDREETPPCLKLRVHLPSGTTDRTTNRVEVVCRMTPALVGIPPELATRHRRDPRAWLVDDLSQEVAVSLTGARSGESDVFLAARPEYGAYGGETDVTCFALERPDRRSVPRTIRVVAPAHEAKEVPSVVAIDGSGTSHPISVDTLQSAVFEGTKLTPPDSFFATIAAGASWALISCTSEGGGSFYAVSRPAKRRVDVLVRERIAGYLPTNVRSGRTAHVRVDCRAYDLPSFARSKDVSQLVSFESD